MIEHTLGHIVAGRQITQKSPLKLAANKDLEEEIDFRISIEAKSKELLHQKTKSEATSPKKKINMSKKK